MSAIYNEIETYAVEWLRNLVEAGHVARGSVDERSVREIQPDDVRGATQFHAFAGIGIWSHALRLAGWSDDVPVWTGSCPCQPFSVAGKGGGVEDERHLWPEWFRLIRECRPPVVFGEQVASPAGRAWFDDVSTDLEGVDYAVGSADLCAAGVGSPHVRQRLFFVAVAGGKRLEGFRVQLRSGRSRQCNAEVNRSGEASSVSDPSCDRREAEGQRTASGYVNRIDDLRRTAEATKGFWGNAEWIVCRDGKARPLEPGTCPVVDGYSDRVGKLRAYGNAIVPQVAAEFVRSFMDVIENRTKSARKPRIKRLATLKRVVKRVRLEISPGFVWEDPVVGHVVACGDASDPEFVRRLVEDVADGPADLSLTDPPYNLSGDAKRIKFATRKDMYLDEVWDVYDDPDFAKLLRGIVDSTVNVTRGNDWFWTSDWWLSDIKRWLRARDLRVWPSYHWCKPNPAPSIRKANPTSAVEYVAMSGKSGAFFDLSALPKQRNWFVAFPDGEFAPAVSPHWVERAVVSQAERLKRAASKKDVNSTQKPLDLVEALVRAGCPEGGLVLDACGGTGTTLVAADRAGRRCVYVDLDPEQVRVAASRLLRDRRER